LQSLGARVEIMLADVGRREDVAELVGAVRGNIGPLRGIVHAAMVLDDGLLPQLDDERFERVLAPKVAGAWNLHELTATEPLDFFVSFSSISSLFGNVGQANYAAANSLLDAFAHYRRSRGLPGLTVNWGALSGVGYLSRQEAVGEQLARQGFAGFSPAEAVRVLGELIDTDRPQVMAARVEWERWAAMSPADAASPRLRHLAPAAQGKPSADGGAGSELAGLLEAPAAEAPRLTQEYLQSRIALVLGSSSATIDPDRPLTDLGLDSLMAVELLATLKAELAVEVAVVQLLQGVTLAELAALVLTELEPRRTATPSAELPVVSEQPRVADEEKPPVAEAITVDGNGGRPALDTAPEEVTAVPAPHTPIRERWTLGQRIARGIVGVGVRTGARIEVEGLEHVPSSGSFVLAGNHLSMSDIPAVWPYIDRSLIPVVSHDLRQTRLLRWILSGIGHAVYIRRGEGDQDALNRGLAVLRAGGALVIAPEGSRSPGGLRRGNTGAAYLATQAGVPVVPVAAWGQEDFTSSWRRLRRAPVRIRFGAPLDFPAGQVSGRELREHSERIMLAIARLLPAEYRGVYADAVAAKGVEAAPGGVTQERDTVGITEPL
jgi:1-acyl-sn-glycerol-3-phosphate acyltransferase